MKWQLGIHSRFLAVCVLFLVSAGQKANAWQDNLHGTQLGADDAGTGFVIDRDGNIIVGGHTINLVDGRGLEQFTVVKLSGATGTELWRTTIGDSTAVAGSVQAVALDPDGNVVAVGSVLHYATGGVFMTVKLDGMTGAERWRHQSDIHSPYGSGFAWAVDVDHAGNVVAGGHLMFPGSYRFFVTKLSSLNGAEIWKREVVVGTGVTEATVLQVNSAGDVLAAGTVGNNFYSNDLFVAKLSGATGSPMWLYRSTDPGNHNTYATSGALDQAGNFVVAGSRPDPLSNNQMFIIKLAGSSFGRRQLPRMFTVTRTRLLWIARGM